MYRCATRHLPPLRVIAGELRGRRLRAPEGRDTRPILDRQKEALFNILQADLPCGAVLDLFAGSGGLGIEALSRGALRACFVERGRRALLALRRNISDLGLEQEARVLTTDALRFAAEDHAGPFELVFCDPPFPLVLERPEALAGLLQRVAMPAGLAREGALILRIPTQGPPPALPVGFATATNRLMGESRLLVLRRA